MPSTEHKFVNAGYSNIIASINASAVTMALVPGGVHAFLPGWAASKNMYLTLVDASANREAVKVTAIGGDNLTIARGQDGTVARAWPAGTLVTQRMVAANLSGVIQKTAFRSITTNPNGTYAAAYPGEKMYQSGPAAGQRRWWKSTTGTKWRLIAGALYGNEYLDSEGYVVTPAKIVPSSDVSVPAGEWLGYDITTNTFGAGAASFSMLNSGLTAPTDATGIGLDWPGTAPVEFGLEDPGSAVTLEIDLTIRAYCHNPPGIQKLTIGLFHGVTQIAADYVIGDIAAGDDDTWANVAGDMTAHEYAIQYLGVSLTAAEAADLRVKFQLTGFGIVVGISEVEAELW